MLQSLILASKSKARAALLKGAGLEFSQIASDLDEDLIKDEGLRRGHSPKAIAVALAEAKALFVSKQHQGLVLGADQVLQLDKALISKVETKEAAKALLHSFSGKTHYLHSALCLSEGDHVVWHCVETAQMSVRPLSEAFIERYVETHSPEILNTVGCYQLEDAGVHLFDKIEGDYFTVLGLPLLPLLRQLRAIGYSKA